MVTWLFTDDGREAETSNNDAAENAAIMYSLLGCCRRCYVNPGHVPTRIPAYNDDYSRFWPNFFP